MTTSNGWGNYTDKNEKDDRTVGTSHKQMTTGFGRPPNRVESCIVSEGMC